LEIPALYTIIYEKDLLVIEIFIIAITARKVYRGTKMETAEN